MIATLPLAISVLLSSTTVAVVDLSSPKSPAVAEAFRKLPSLRANAMSAKGTNAAVTDAESVGLICTVDDGPCLEKLMVLIRADELVAFSAGATTVAVVDVTGSGNARRAAVRTEFSPAATAQAAWDALAGAPPPTTTTPTPTTTTTPTTTPPPETGTGGPVVDAQQKPAVADSGGGISPALPVAIAGGAVGVACGTATAVLYADLVRQAKAAEGGTAPLPESFYAASDITVALAGCTVVALGAGVVGTILVFTSD